MTRNPVFHIFDSGSLVYPKSHKQHDIGCTEDNLLKMCKTEGFSYEKLSQNIAAEVIVKTLKTDLFLGDGLEDGQLLCLLEAAEAGRVGACLGGDHDHGRVGPEGGGHAGHEVGDAGAVLGHAHARLASDAGVAVGHVRRVL